MSKGRKTAGLTVKQTKVFGGPLKPIGSVPTKRRPKGGYAVLGRLSTIRKQARSR